MTTNMYLNGLPSGMKRMILSFLTVIALFTNVFAVEVGSFFGEGTHSRKAVSLTFDDGPGPYTERILEVLKRYGIKATFFMEASQVEIRPDKARHVMADGHEIGGHSYSHPDFYHYKKDDKGRFLAKEIDKSNAIFDKVLGKRPAIMRMPYGYVKPWVKQVAKEKGLILINWSFGCDWKKMTKEDLARAYISSIHSGAIFLMHDGGKNRQTTLDALPEIIDALKNRGYEILPAGELLGLNK